MAGDAGSKLMMNALEFGGDWTADKLRIIESYLYAYTTALKHQPFRLIYVDAFAGSGYYLNKAGVSGADGLEIDKLMEGSANRALNVTNRPFDQFIFIEKNDSYVQSLSGIASENNDREIKIVHGNANDAVPDFCKGMDAYDRAVVFLDPFGTEVEWTTIEAIAGTGKIDCWILFPLSRLTRLLPNKSLPRPDSIPELERVFGNSDEWQSFYDLSSQQSLLGDQQWRRELQETISDHYRQKLRTVFAGVSNTKHYLRNGNRGPMFDLIFAASNQAGARVALPIANDILTSGPSPSGPGPKSDPPHPNQGILFS